MANAYKPNYVMAPGVTLLEMLEERGWTQAELAHRMGRPIKTINEITKGKTSITPETALQLERTLGVSASFWLNNERRYREHLAREHEEGALAQHASWLKELPVKKMIDWGWIPAARTAGERVREVLKFFAIANPMPWPELAGLAAGAASRKSLVYDSHSAALAAWLRRGELEAEKVATAPYDEQKLRLILPTLRGLTLESQASFEQKLRERCRECGVAVVFVPELPGVRVSGVARWLGASGRQKAVVQMSYRYRSNDSFWFTFFHELGHLLLHRKHGLFIDFDGQADTDQQEAEANEFAAEVLIPAAKLSPSKKAIWNESRIRLTAQMLGVHPGILVGRLQYGKALPYRTALNSLKAKLSWAETKAP
jgi:HTH-type transcriptional regulator/antitoxin HigA